MSCCGRGWTSITPLKAPAAASHSAESRLLAARFIAQSEQPIFEYTGRTAVTVHGGATGKRYRFAAPRTRVAVDPRDRPSLAQVPVLRQV